MNDRLPDPAPVAAVNPDEFARRVDLSRTTAYRLLREGQVRSLKVGRRRLIPVTEIDRFLSAAHGAA